MDSSGSHKVVQIPEDTFRKMRDKLKKQDERIKSLEDQIIAVELEKGSGGAAASDEMAAKLNEQMKQLESVIEDQKRQITEYKIQIDQMSSASSESSTDAEVLSVRKELEEKEELVKFLMEREKQLLTAIEGMQNSPNAGGGGGAQYLDQGAALLQKLEKEMEKRENLVTELLSKIMGVKEVMEQLKQNLSTLPSKEEIDNAIKQAMQAETFEVAPGSVTYEGMLERISKQLEKVSQLQEKLRHEQESVDVYKSGITKRFDHLTDSLEAEGKLIVERGERLKVAKDFVEKKYAEWKAQDEARAREMNSLLDLMKSE